MGKKSTGNGIFSMQRDKLRSFMSDALALQAENKATATELSEHYKRCAENGIHTGAFKAIQKLLKSERGDALAFLEAFDNYRDELLKDMERDLVKEAKKKVEPASVGAAANPVQSPAELPQSADVEQNSDPVGAAEPATSEPKKKRGRKSKAELAQQAAAMHLGGTGTVSQTAEGTTVLTDDDPLAVGAAETEGYNPDDLNMKTGVQAFKAGKSHLENPHEPGTTRHTRWQLGWQWAADQASDTAQTGPAMSQGERESAGMF